MYERRKNRLTKPHLWLIAFIGVIVPRRLRPGWRQEWEAELSYREELLAEWDNLDHHNKLDLLWHSLGAFMDALWLQPRRMEDEMFQDLRFGTRMLLKHRGFTAVAVLTLALGIGANTAVFSVINAVLLRALPFTDANRLVLIWETHPDVRGPIGTYPDFQDWRSQAQSCQGMAAFSNRRFDRAKLTGQGETVEVKGTLISHDLFSLLGLRPILGRNFLPEDE